MPNFSTPSLASNPSPLSSLSAAQTVEVAAESAKVLFHDEFVGSPSVSQKSFEDVARELTLKRIAAMPSFAATSSSGGLLGRLLGVSKSDPEQHLQQLAKALHQSLKSSVKDGAALAQMEKSLESIRDILYGDDDGVVSEADSKKLLEAAMKNDLLGLIADAMPLLSFESRKFAVHIFRNVLKHGVSSTTTTSIKNPADFIGQLMKGFDDTGTRVHYAEMLRGCVSHEFLLKHLLTKDALEPFFKRYLAHGDALMAGEAFATFKAILSSPSKLVSEFLQKNHELFFGRFHELLKSPNFLLRLQGNRLLSEMLVYRGHYETMIRYVNDDQNLKDVMNLFREQSKMMRREVFHVFKLFAANPKKTDNINTILKANKKQLVSIIRDAFGQVRDDQLKGELQIVEENLST